MDLFWKSLRNVLTRIFVAVSLVGMISLVIASVIFAFSIADHRPVPVHSIHPVGEWINVVPNDFEGDFADGVLQVQVNGSLCTSGDTLAEHLSDCTGQTLLFHLNSGYARVGGRYKLCAVSLDKKPEPNSPWLCVYMEPGVDENDSLYIPADLGKFYLWGAWVEDELVVPPSRRD